MIDTTEWTILNLVVLGFGALIFKLWRRWKDEGNDDPWR